LPSTQGSSVGQRNNGLRSIVSRQAALALRGIKGDRAQPDTAAGAGTEAGRRGSAQRLARPPAAQPWGHSRSFASTGWKLNDDATYFTAFLEHMTNPARGHSQEGATDCDLSVAGGDDASESDTGPACNAPASPETPGPQPWPQVLARPRSAPTSLRGRRSSVTMRETPGPQVPRRAEAARSPAAGE
jgi:hypothetical protein